MQPDRLPGDAVVLRPPRHEDVPAIVEACRDSIGSLLPGELR